MLGIKTAITLGGVCMSLWVVCVALGFSFPSKRGDRQGQSPLIYPIWAFYIAAYSGGEISRLTLAYQLANSRMSSSVNSLAISDMITWLRLPMR